MTSELTLETIQDCADFPESYDENAFNASQMIGQLARQLLAAMRQKAKLYDALHDLHSLYAETDRTLDEGEVIGEVQELLYGNQGSEYCNNAHNDQKP